MPLLHVSRLDPGTGAPFTASGTNSRRSPPAHQGAPDMITAVSQQPPTAPDPQPVPVLASTVLSVV
ncbi:MAG: hypothetical protein ACRDRO_04585, partial [Pseudonocardiaceae bacterium]